MVQNTNRPSTWFCAFLLQQQPQQQRKRSRKSSRSNAKCVTHCSHYRTHTRRLAFVLTFSFPFAVSLLVVHFPFHSPSNIISFGPPNRARNSQHTLSLSRIRTQYISIAQEIILISNADIIIFRHLPRHCERGFLCCLFNFTSTSLSFLHFACLACVTCADAIKVGLSCPTTADTSEHSTHTES